MLTESLSVYRVVIYAHLLSTALEPGICYSAVHLRSFFCIKRTWKWVYTLSHRPMILSLTVPSVDFYSFLYLHPWSGQHHFPPRITEIIKTSFPATPPHGTSVFTATVIITYFEKFRSHHVTPLLKAQLLILFAAHLKVTTV